MAKTAIITGSSRGIGAAIALRLAKDGMNIAFNDLNMTMFENNDIVDRVKALGVEAEVFCADVSKYAECEAMVKAVKERFGTIDVLVNNAGITRDGLLMRMKEEDWDAVITTNLKGVFNCTKAAIKYMMKQRSGSIVNISSIVGVMGNAGQANYCAAKAGVIGFTKATAKEVAARGIRVNAIAPGFIKTDMTSVLPEKVVEAMLAGIPLNRLGETEDIAKAVLFLASSDANYITGQTLHVDGGMVM